MPTELIGKTSSRLYWLAMLVLVTTIIVFVSRHFLDPMIAGAPAGLHSG